MPPGRAFPTTPHSRMTPDRAFSTTPDDQTPPGRAYSGAPDGQMSPGRAYSAALDRQMSLERENVDANYFHLHKPAGQRVLKNLGAPSALTYSRSNDIRGRQPSHIPNLTTFRRLKGDLQPARGAVYGRGVAVCGLRVTFRGPGWQFERARSAPCRAFPRGAPRSGSGCLHSGR